MSGKKKKSGNKEKKKLQRNINKQKQRELQNKQQTNWDLLKKRMQREYRMKQKQREFQMKQRYRRNLICKLYLIRTMTQWKMLVTKHRGIQMFKWICICQSSKKMIRVNKYIHKTRMTTLTKTKGLTEKVILRKMKSKRKEAKKYQQVLISLHQKLEFKLMSPFLKTVKKKKKRSIYSIRVSLEKYSMWTRMDKYPNLRILKMLQKM